MKEEFTSGTNWKEILLEIYRHAPHLYSGNRMVPFSSDENPLAKKLKIKGDELFVGIGFLEKQKLIQRIVAGDKNKSYMLQLTEKGFNISLGIENQNDSSKLQFTLLVFTGMIVLTSAFDFVSKIAIINPLVVLIVYLITILALATIGLLFNKELISI